MYGAACVQDHAKQLIAKATTKESKSYAHTMLANVHFFSCPDKVAPPASAPDAAKAAELKAKANERQNVRSLS